MGAFSKLPLVFGGLLCFNLVAYSQPSPIVKDNAKPVVLSRQFSFTEGPAVDKQGNISLPISLIIKSGSTMREGI